jgi:hypothetical protein
MAVPSRLHAVHNTPSLVPIRTHSVLEGLNREIPIEQSVSRNAVLIAESRNCNLDIRVDEYAHISTRKEIRGIFTSVRSAIKTSGLSNGLATHLMSHSDNPRLFVCDFPVSLSCVLLIASLSVAMCC